MMRITTDEYVTKLEQERDQARAALERIAGGTQAYGDNVYAGVGLLDPRVRIARAALAQLPQAAERAKLLDAVVATARRCAERGYPCSHCDLGYEDDACSCFDQMAETKERVSGLQQTIAALDAHDRAQGEGGK